ncbi:hypothetical protein N0V83_008070 [Neocucurbitaria cava]|uniref:BTB domain-containing protein n=1 Tax=Neocucurbitaria cava TaxID=798079 RepID=A0A9W9CJ78_9PLEO|nr:hypothetical protein N0V83_008070 [Neocucurbitaria cava]
MSTPEKTAEAKKVYPPLVALPQCPHTTKPPSPKDYGSTVTVIVGEGDDCATFHVYEGLLKHYSSYFRGALSGNWSEGRVGPVELPEDDPETFAVFFHFLYTGKLYSDLKENGTVPMSPHKILEVYIFGDARGIPELCNATIDLLFQTLLQLWAFPANKLSLIYDNTPSNSMLRKFLVLDAVCSFGFDVLESENHLLPIEFLREVILLGRDRNMVAGIGIEKSDWVRIFKESRCEFHTQHA